mmetsp:Transcript_96707/g.282697  ORF Transcript_96707/g.282697 Transcript_96707/m.282697 type:complete len:339 (-) Transcript_96707:82-1098(-)
MCKAKVWTRIWTPGVLLPLAAALRRHPPDELVGLSRDTMATAMADFKNLKAFYSELDLAQIMDELKRVPVDFLELGGENVTITPGNLALPTGRRSTASGPPQRCAIVSSSQNVLRGAAGWDIDAVDGPVLRMNYAVTEGYEDFVGSRFEVMLVNDRAFCWWINHNWSKRRQAPDPRVKMVLLSGHPTTHRCARYMSMGRPQEVPSFMLGTTSEETFRGLDRVMDLVVERGPASLRRLTKPGIKPPHATSGLVGGLLLMNMCKEVLSYGFLEGVECQEHYWADTHSCTKDMHHRITREHMLWKVISSTQGTNFTGEGIAPGWPHLQTKALAQEAKAEIA